eukprot:CAMPEP_0172470290 /NCGR_PEP_ID=MMETSP1065-20121228/65963_1 /TAXON_ID=265537 /ORGANISM="Amphiprora paludosa, Strain CCMP125" /LENGTH=307 /DNA_ID=CAMNT_0013228177 /DNA_START=44 /DNA_END=964 /DNA_ORIENTATION=-
MSEEVPQNKKRKLDQSLRVKIVAGLARACPASQVNKKEWCESIYDTLLKECPDRLPEKARSIAFNVKRNGEYLCSCRPEDVARMSPDQMARGTTLASLRESIVLGGWDPPSSERPSLLESSKWVSTANKQKLELVIYEESSFRDFSTYWRSSVPRVVVRHGDITSLEGEFHALVSPANTMGNMDGGIDRVYADFLGWSYGRPYHDPNPLQLGIDRFKGEENARLELGEAVLIKDLKVHLIASPTMILPGKIEVNSRVVFQATKAVFQLWKANEKIRVLRMPSFGTGYGQVPGIISASQTMEAFCHVW